MKSMILVPLLSIFLFSCSKVDKSGSEFSQYLEKRLLIYFDSEDLDLTLKALDEIETYIIEKMPYEEISDYLYILSITSIRKAFIYEKLKKEKEMEEAYSAALKYSKSLYDKHETMRKLTEEERLIDLTKTVMELDQNFLDCRE